MRVPLPEPFASAGLRSSDGARNARFSEPCGSQRAAGRADRQPPLLARRHGFSRRRERRPITPPNCGRVSHDDAEGDASFEAGNAGRPIRQHADDLEKTDAQRLAEAWDVDLREARATRERGPQGRRRRRRS